MTPGRCSQPKCRNPSTIRVLGAELCEQCWKKHAQELGKVRQSEINKSETSVPM